MAEAIGMMTGGMMGGGGVFMWLMWALFVTLLLAFLATGVVWMIRGMGGSSSGRSTRTAREELDVRYAQGDLTREEYLQRRADLEGPRS